MIKLFVMKKMILTIAMIAGMSAITNIQTLQAASHFQIETVSQCKLPLFRTVLD